MESILITGGAGFIGIHTSVSFLDKGYRLIIIDSLINSSYESVKKLKNLYINKKNYSNDQIIFQEGDIRDINFIRHVFNQSTISGYKINFVIHFAGLKSVPDSFLKENEYWEVNVNGTKNLLKVMEENKCFKMVFSSSATVYSQEEVSPLSEKAKTNANNPYGQTKLEVEKILRNLTKSKLYKWQIISLRYFNPIGAHKSGLFGENPKDIPNNLFPIICQVASKIKKDLFIYGNDWPTKDGTAIRDYIHVMDIAEGHLSAIDFIKKNKYETIFLILNLGTGKGTSVLELIKIFQKVNDLKINFKFTQRRDGDKAVVFADNKKAFKILNWKPKRSLEDMCKDGWESEIKKSL